MGQNIKCLVFLALFANIAKAQNDEIIVLSERMDKGESLNVKPIGAIRILQNDSLQSSEIDEFLTQRIIENITHMSPNIQYIFVGKWLIY